MNKKGFTLIEVLISVGILAFVLCGVLASYVGLFFLGDVSRQYILATNSAQAKIEEIKNNSATVANYFDNQLLALNGTTFAVTGFTAGNASGTVWVANTAYSDLKQVTVDVCFRAKGSNIIGEDRNFDGVLQNTEDINGNTRMDSPVEMVTLIAK